MAGYLSQTQLHPGEWSLHPEVFASVVDRWGLPQVDLFVCDISECNDDEVLFALQR